MVDSCLLPWNLKRPHFIVSYCQQIRYMAQMGQSSLLQVQEQNTWLLMQEVRILYKLILKKDGSIMLLHCLSITLFLKLFISNFHPTKFL